MAVETAEKKARLRSDYPYRLECQTRWFDNDVYAHMNNTIYAQLFDSIINHYLVLRCDMKPFAAKGKSDETFSSERKDENSQLGIVVSSFCDYFHSVGFPDILELCLRVSRLGFSSVTYEVGIFKKGEDDVKVVGGYTHVFCARETKRPAAGGIEPKIREGLRKLLVDRDKVAHKL